MIYLELFLGFLKVGLFAFGGAYGAIPLIRDVVLSCGWLSDAELMYMIAISESTPGPIMVNLATYVGSSQAGLAGSALATFAVILPAFVIILLIMVLLKTLLKKPYTQAVLRGMKPCVVGIVLATGIRMTITACLADSGPTPDYRGICIAVLLCVSMYLWKRLRKKKFPPILLIPISAVLGMVFYTL